MTSCMATEKVVPPFPEYLLLSNQLPTTENFDLYDAAANGNLALVVNALRNGGKPNFFNVKQEHRTALHIAAENGHAEVVQYLLQNGASIDCVVETSQATPLILAAERGHVAVIRVLMQSIPPPDLAHKNGYGNTALHVAARGCHLEAAQSLLSFGAYNDEAQNISLAPAPLPTPISPSSLVSLANNKGSTALHFLCYADSQSETSLLLAEALLAAGSDVNAKDCRGMTPFLVCCTKGRVDMINLLVSRGADISVRDGAGKNASELSAFYKCENILPLIETLTGSATLNT